ncbi:DUF6624 domain-containing protein [Streptomyces sp. NPDC002932]|uniref:DUF6624 domain-containing protein n=1 Tax=Streptomyces sp. NPDC002932 TaxID=3364672 RepID=UPI0036BF5193
MSPDPKRPDLGDELIARAASGRSHWSRLARLELPDQQVGVGRHTDHTNAVLLGRIIADYGWPDVFLVGEDGATAAWQIALHADTQREIQQIAGRLLYAAVQQQRAPVRQWAHLHDRCLLNGGLPQLYGTQYVLGPHGAERRPVREPSKLDEHRAEVGLPPADEALQHLRRRLATKPPTETGTARAIELADAA